MVWTIVKSDNKLLNKDTRWDRIRKKHSGNLNTMKTTLVKKFIEKDFIGKTNIKLMNGDVDIKQNLNPVLVMDLRHEMIQKAPKRIPTYVKQHKTNIDKCIVHNLEVEEHYILNELSKFRAQLEKNRQQCKIKPKTINSDHFLLNNNDILKSLENTNRHVKDFYEAPLQAIEKFSHLIHDDMEPAVAVADEDKAISEVSIVSSARDDQMENVETRCVRFDDSVGVVKYNREESTCSNTSNGIDSVISDLAEEALNEIEAEGSLHNDILAIQIEGSSLKRDNVEPLIVTKMITEQDAQIGITEIASSSSDENEESVSNEQNAIIEQLFIAKAHSSSVILRNYFFKWIHYTTIEKIERQNVTSKTDRIHKINAFLDHIRREKKNQATDIAAKPTGESKIQTANITKKYQSKIKIQQDIIDLQKLKLERQERLITELKLNKLTEEAKEARDEIKAELKNALRTGDSKSRAKAKCLQIMGNLRDEEDDEFSRLQGKAMIQPRFLTNMQERALERSVKHEQAKQRRLQQEAEREAVKMAIEESKRLEDEEAKRMRIELLKEKRRQEKMVKIIRERERQKTIDNNKKAHQFCRNYLLRRIGMEGFKRLLERKKTNQQKADHFRRQLVQKNVFIAWKRLYQSIVERKIYMADELHERILKRKSFQLWICYLQEERSKYLVAVDWYELKLSQVVFSQWCGFTKLQKLVEDMKMKQAELHHEWHLKWKVLDRWQRLPQIMKLEKETDERRQRWRMKIWELLPDYTPNRDLIM